MSISYLSLTSKHFALDRLGNDRRDNDELVFIGIKRFSLVMQRSIALGAGIAVVRADSITVNRHFGLPGHPAIIGSFGDWFAFNNSNDPAHLHLAHGRDATDWTVV